MRNVHKSLLDDGFQLAYSFNPRQYYFTGGDGEHIMGLVGRGFDRKIYSEIKIMKIEELFPNEKLDESVKGRRLVYVKPSDNRNA